MRTDRVAKLIALFGCVVVVGCDGCAEPPPAPESSCLGCHRPGGSGIESAHPFAELSCTDCHGGDPEAVTKQAAHILKPPGVGFVRGAPTDVLSTLPPEYMRFINPGDYRIADVGCGAANPASGTTGCHDGLVQDAQTSVMTTFVGHYNVPRYLAGLQDSHDAIFGSRELTNPDFDPATAPMGTVSELVALRPPEDDEAEPRDSVQNIMDNYLVKSCTHCHAYSFGYNNASGNYRSSGCTSCHMVYENDGLSRSDDPTVDTTRPPHAAKHELTSAIPVTQCEHCHFQGARIGLLFQGFREGGFDDQIPPNATFLSEPRHDHGPDYYIVDEDDTNRVDETPPDLHYSAGMVCADCHVGSDVHGDGNIYSTAKFQVGIRCEDCHGTVRDAIVENDEGFFVNSKGYPLRAMRRLSDDSIILTTKQSFGGVGLELRVPQIKNLLDSGQNPRMQEAMGVDENGFSHTDSLECYACHTSYRQACLGCHVEMNDGFSQTDHQTGRLTKGLVRGSRDYYSLSDYFLGLNHRGKVTTMCPSEQIFLSYVDEDGNRTLDEQVRTTASGQLGFGWQPNHQHTTARVPQNCDRCHVTPDESNLDDVRGTYGFGTGEFFMPDGDGVMYDLTKVLNDDGSPMVDFGHEGVSTVPIEMLNRALDLRVEPQARGEP